MDVHLFTALLMIAVPDIKEILLPYAFFIFSPSNAAAVGCAAFVAHPYQQHVIWDDL